MKLKLMIAAAAAAMIGGAYAACTPEAKAGDAWVYNWTFSGKTTTGYLVKGTTTGRCAPGGTADCAIRIPASLKIQGYTYKCLPCCGGFTELADDGEAFYSTKPNKEYFAFTNKAKMFTKGLKVTFGHVIGKKAKDVELSGRFTGTTGDSGEHYDFIFSGLGKYDLNNTRISSVSGNFAGKMEVPHYPVYDVTLKGCPEAWYWDCTGTYYLGKDKTVAYGSWSMKYNSSASKKFYQSGTLVKLPTIK